MDSIFNIFDTHRKEINGPVNVIRLEGTVDNTAEKDSTDDPAKVIYIFLDDQTPISGQTECLNVYSIDVQKYIANSFHKISQSGSDSNRICDFFVDVTPTQYRIDPVERAQVIETHGTAVPRPTYADQIIRLARSSNTFDPQSRRSQVSKIFQNVRLHYTDISEPLMQRIVQRLAEAEAIVRNSSMLRKASPGEIPSSVLLDPYAYVLLETVKQEIAQYMRIYQIMLTRPSATIDEPHTQFARYLRKLLYGYNISTVRRILTEYVHSSFDQLSQLSKQIDETIKLFVTSVHTQENPPFTYADGFYKYDIAKTRLDVESAGQRILDTHTLFVNSLRATIYLSDLYLLRRFLDKEYITHAVIYASREKGVHIIRILTGDFDFKVTHAAYIADQSSTNMAKLNQIIKQRTRNNHSIADLFTHPKMFQCSDITNFPDNFQ